MCVNVTHKVRSGGLTLINAGMPKISHTVRPLESTDIHYFITVKCSVQFIRCFSAKFKGS